MNDTIKYSRNWITGFENGSTVKLAGCQNYTGNYFDLPIGEYEYIWEVTKNNITTYHSETFTLTEGDSTIFQIDY